MFVGTFSATSNECLRNNLKLSKFSQILPILTLLVISYNSSKKIAYFSSGDNQSVMTISDSFTGVNPYIPLILSLSDSVIIILRCTTIIYLS